MSLPIPTHLQLGKTEGRNQAERARKWIARLSEAGSAPELAAKDLYAGEHWSVTRKFSTPQQPGEEIRLWVCSAGYGLIPAEAVLMPHHATLTPGQADSVPGDWTLWWSLLSEWRGPSPGEHRSIRALTASDPDAVFIFILSKNYLRACSADIISACETLSHMDRFMIVSTGGNVGGALAKFAIPADARLQAHFGGTRRALNARVGAYLIEDRIRSKNEASERLSQLLAAQPPIVRYNRTKQSDREILDAITTRLEHAPTMSANRLLREFRDAGLACEQRRFSRLYRQIWCADGVTDGTVA